MLTIASILMDSAFNVGVDIDQDALELAAHNLDAMEMGGSADLVNMNVQDLQLNTTFDTVVMNPPFGTRIAGIDTIFLEKGMEYANVVYSLHKTSTRQHFVRKAEAEGWSMEVVAELRYDIPKTFKWHKQKSKDIDVDLYRFAHVS
jgi:predicted RNA methylase